MIENDYKGNMTKFYFKNLESKLNKELFIANNAKKKGDDPHPFVEIPLAKDLAERVENLIGVKGVGNRIRELSKIYTREEAALHLGKDIAIGSVGNFKTKEEKINAAIRVSMALLTEGVVAAPIEGIANIVIDKNSDGSEYLRIFYSGPIRSAGGTAQALSVLVGDYVRRTLGLDKFKPRKEIIDRYIEEIRLYNNHSSLQYNPTDEEVKIIVENCPICVDGDGTEEYEVEGYRNLKELQSNKVRGGMALVIAEGLILKAPKIKKHVLSLGFDDWNFLDKITGFQTASKKDAEFELKPKDKYLNDLIAGRPLFSHPSASGGFRLRYGRSRNTSFAAAGINPASMVVLDNFITNGTQLKVERPGKAAAISSVDSIDGPFVRLTTGDYTQINDYNTALKLKDQIEYIIDIGEILFNYGDFLENNHPLVPSSYCFEWWLYDLSSIFKNLKTKNNKNTFLLKKLINLSEEKSIELSKLGIPLHPKYTYPWNDISYSDLKYLSYYISLYGTIKKIYNNQLIKEMDFSLITNNDIEKKKLLLEVNLNYDSENKIQKLIEILLIKHKIDNKILYIIDFKVFLVCLGLIKKEKLVFENENIIYPNKKFEYLEKHDINNTLNSVIYLSNITIKSKAPTRIGARMGRPEKSNVRKMNPAAQVLFPISSYGGPTRNIVSASKFKTNSNDNEGKLILKLGNRICKACKKETYKWRCECGNYTIEKLHCKFCNIETNLEICPKCNKSTTCVQFKEINIKNILNDIYKKLKIREENKIIKGVKELMNKSRTPEPIEKGILRSIYGVYMFKDGTIRYDMSDLPLTHFKASEINITIEDLYKLGYNKDINNNPIISTEQIINLFAQDIVISFDCANYMIKVSQFIDSLLEKYYKCKPYYNITSIKDLIGTLVIGLAPHTSAGILGRIIGFTNSSVCFAHPYFHASKRRNCDGDEDSIMLLLDGLLNFSKEYLPDKRGGKMDAPLVLTTIINPTEIDKEAHNIDVCQNYPADFYNSTELLISPDILSKQMDLISSRLGTIKEYEDFMYTHETSNIATGPKLSSYKTLETMEEKINSQLNLAKKIRAVNESDVAERVLRSHFLPDIIGNLRAFSKQTTRCAKCSKKYRRPPLCGYCQNCGNKIILTVHEGTVKKYINISKKIANEYNVSPYLKERINRINEDIESTFDNVQNQQLNLSNYM